MTRLALAISIALVVGCTHPQQATTPTSLAPAKAEDPKAAPPAPARNFVCERVASEGNKKAVCEPEYTGAGELLTHSARLTIDGVTNVCAMNDRAPQVVCVPLFYMPPQPTEEKQPEKPGAKQPAPKADAKPGAKK